MNIIDILKNKLRHCFDLKTRYLRWRNSAYTGDFAIKGKSAVERQFLRVELWLMEIALLCGAVVAQPLLRLFTDVCPAPASLVELFLGWGWLNVTVVVLILAAMICLLLVVPAQQIPNDAECRCFMRTEAAVFVAMSVGLPIFDWLPVYWPWTGATLSLTEILWKTAVITGGICLLGIMFTNVLDFLYSFVMLSYRIFHKKKPVVLALPCSCQTEECQMMVSQETEEPRVGCVRIIGEAPESLAFHQKK